jgi:hypothetical protein
LMPGDRHRAWHYQQQGKNRLEQVSFSYQIV